MVTRSVEQWQALFKQHDESGLNSSHFCRENDLCPKYFSKRKKDLRWFSGKLISNDRQTTSSKLVKVKRATASVVEKPMSVTLQMNDIQLPLPTTLSPQWIANLVKALNA
jgi:hypothetical protein